MDTYLFTFMTHFSTEVDTLSQFICTYTGLEITQNIMVVGKTTWLENLVVLRDIW